MTTGRLAREVELLANLEVTDGAYQVIKAYHWTWLFPQSPEMLELLFWLRLMKEKWTWRPQVPLLQHQHQHNFRLQNRNCAGAEGEELVTWWPPSKREQNFTHRHQQARFWSDVSTFIPRSQDPQRIKSDRSKRQTKSKLPGVFEWSSLKFSPMQRDAFSKREHVHLNLKSCYWQPCSVLPMVGVLPCQSVMAWSWLREHGENNHSETALFSYGVGSRTHSRLLWGMRDAAAETSWSTRGGSTSKCTYIQSRAGQLALPALG